MEGKGGIGIIPTPHHRLAHGKNHGKSAKMETSEVTPKKTPQGRGWNQSFHENMIILWMEEILHHLGWLKHVETL